MLIPSKQLTKQNIYSPVPAVRRTHRSLLQCAVVATTVHCPVATGRRGRRRCRPRRRHPHDIVVVIAGRWRRRLKTAAVFDDVPLTVHRDPLMLLLVMTDGSIVCRRLLQVRHIPLTGVIADDAADASDGDVVQPRSQTIVVVDGLRD